MRTSRSRVAVRRSGRIALVAPPSHGKDYGQGSRTGMRCAFAKTVGQPDKKG
jgi:hypothetical protein